MKVRARTYRSGRKAWQLDLGEIDGKRVQRSFDTREAAMIALRDAREARKKHGELGADLGTAEVAEIVHLKQRLAGVGASLAEAVEYYLTHARILREPVTLGELIKRFQEAKDEAQKSVRYRQQLRVSLGSLARAWTLKKAHEVTRADVEAWLRSGGWQPKTKNNYLADARALFAWALRQGHVSRNPCVEVEKLPLYEEEIETLTVDECERLLQASRGGKFAGYIVLGMFCGLRRSEVERLRWEAVDATAGTVIVGGRTTKTRKRRVVDISANAIAWLREIPEAMRESEAKICPPRFANNWQAFREGHGFAEWPHNALRHTFASMHYAMHQNEALLQAQMAHTNATVLHRHYRALKTKAEAERFWSLLPG